MRWDLEVILFAAVTALAVNLAFAVAWLRPPRAPVFAETTRPAAEVSAPAKPAMVCTYPFGAFLVGVPDQRELRAQKRCEVVAGALPAE